MQENSEFFIGLDTSKLKISVAVADGDRSGEVRFYGVGTRFASPDTLRSNGA